MIYAVAFIALLMVLDIQFAKASDEPGNAWMKTYGGSQGGFANSLIQTQDGGYAVVGSYHFDSVPSSMDGYDSWFIKTDSSGKTVLDKKFNMGLNDYAADFFQTQDAGYLIVGNIDGGYTTSGIHGEIYVPKNFYLLKLGSGGNLLWNKTEGGTPIAIAQARDGGFAVASYTEDNSKVAITKFDSSGNQQWTTKTNSLLENPVKTLIETNDGGFAVAGQVFDPVVYKVHAWLMKTDAQGNVQLNKTIGTSVSLPAYINSMIQNDEGSYVFAGAQPNESSGDTSVWVLKADSNANLEWTKTLGNGTASCITKTASGGYALAVDGDQENILKIDSSGNLQMSQRIDGAISFSKIIQTSDQGYGLVGKIVFEGQSEPYALFVKTDDSLAVPEFPAAIIPTLLLTVTVSIIITKQKRHSRNL
jgi:hypothetical protein